MTDSTNWFAAVATLLGTLGAVWLKGRVDRAGGRESTLASAEEKFREDLLDRIDKQNVRIDELEKKIIELQAENEKLHIDNRELRAQVTKLKAQIEQMSGDGK